MQTKLKVKLISHTPEPEKIISTAAKLCYSDSNIADIEDGLTEENIDKFLNKLMDMGHESPTEHVSFTFGIEGVSRSLTHQLVRHRVASYSQKSQRYVMEGQFDYIIPPEIKRDTIAKKLFISAMKDDQLAYDAIVERLEYINTKEGMNELDATKKAIEDARYVLPNACETKIITTMNARELLHFFEKRCCMRAQWEIRELATEMLRQVKTIAPTLFKNAGSSCVKGSCPEGTMTCGRIKEMREKFKNL